MSEQRWTPGPWVTDPETRPAEICTIHGMPRDERTNGQGWAHVRGALGHWDVDEEVAMANAHLIAAAPELYEALEDLMDHESRARVMPIGPAWDAARAALAKARGES